jgi:hypothetical protein
MASRKVDKQTVTLFFRKELFQYINTPSDWLSAGLQSVVTSRRSPLRNDRSSARRSGPDALATLTRLR